MPSHPSDDMRANLRTFMTLYSLSVSGWSKLAGLPESTLRNFLAGRSNTLNLSTVSQLAAAINLTAVELLSGSSQSDAPYNVKVVGETNASEWMRGELDESFLTLIVPVDTRFPNIKRFGVVVGDSSFDSYYPVGSILICATYQDIGRMPTVGDRVICLERKERRLKLPWTNSDYPGRASVREIVEADGDQWLSLRSRSPKWHQPIRVTIWEPQQVQVPVDDPGFFMDDGFLAGWLSSSFR